MKKSFLLGIAILFLAAGIFLFFPDESIENEPADFSSPRELSQEGKSNEEEKIEVIPPAVEEQKTINKNQETEKEIPQNILTKVPFTSQAPYAHWDERHEEACEEASLLMIYYYLENKNLSPEISEKEIQKMIDYQIKEYGDYKDTNARETVRLAQDFYDIDNLEIIYDFKKEDIKKELAKGNPVIVPAAGRSLGNPYFTPPGPLYHNLVLVGYSGNTIITNDPGTKRGEGYKYDIDILYNAIHDFPGSKEAINQGRKAMIVIGDN